MEFVSLIGLIALEVGAVKTVDASTTFGQGMADKGSFQNHPDRDQVGQAAKMTGRGLLPSFDVTSRVQERERFFKLQFLCGLSLYEVDCLGQ